MPLIPGAFYAFVTITYIMNAQIGFNMSWTAAYIVGTVCAVVYLVVIIMYGKSALQKLNSRKNLNYPQNTFKRA